MQEYSISLAMNYLQTDGKFLQPCSVLEIIWWVFCMQYRLLFNCFGSACLREFNILNSLFELLCLHSNANVPSNRMSINSEEAAILSTGWMQHFSAKQENTEDATCSSEESDNRRRLSHNTNKLFQTEIFRRASSRLKLVFVKALHFTSSR